MISGEKVVLTEVRKTDSDTLFGWINIAETMRFNAPYAPVTRAAHDGWFETLGRDASKVIFAIRTAVDGPAIGTVQLIDIHRVHRSAELTIRIGADKDRGHGYGSDAVRSACDFAFRDLNLQRVWLRVFATNGRAIKAYEKAGLEREGVMRRAAWIDGVWTDEVVMAALRPSP